MALGVEPRVRRAFPLDSPHLEDRHRCSSHQHLDLDTAGSRRCAASPPLDDDVREAIRAAIDDAMDFVARVLVQIPDPRRLLERGTGQA
jgi:hypothetical protein